MTTNSLSVAKSSKNRYARGSISCKAGSTTTQRTPSSIIGRTYREYRICFSPPKVDMIPQSRSAQSLGRNTRPASVTPTMTMRGFIGLGMAGADVRGTKNDKTETRRRCRATVNYNFGRFCDGTARTLACTRSRAWRELLHCKQDCHIVIFLKLRAAVRVRPPLSFLLAA